MGTTPQGFCYFLALKSNRGVSKYYNNFIQKHYLHLKLDLLISTIKFLAAVFYNDGLAYCISNLPLLFS